MGGVPFNDAYRYMDWLLTVPLLLIEILLVMKLDDETFNAKAKSLGVGSALMIVSGYYGELTVTGDLTPRWICWFISMAFFLYIVQELMVGLSEATEQETDRVQGQDQDGPAGDCDQLVHLPRRVPLPDVGHLGLQGRGRHPGGLLCLGHHLEVRCWLVHLPDFLRQVEAGGMNEELGFFEVEVGALLSARGRHVGTPPSLLTRVRCHG